ncbi:MAG: penicillin-binding protein 2 [Betaproteobacteria bacterium RIFCSPLOWO2_12_FULL_63_13]|nr:MAG: penicillin-binding protein 2 [Betaproteobacteria bacterium RIFCSPLOWO2_02_FULL_63_19]OGA42964.1 MAG: penicillin-binding protein 2 [Betaproteobacteria bacterium RIFCSPLOWO2_12_FULL_63_13]
MKLGEFKNTQLELYYFQLRLGVAGMVVLAAFTLLLARFFYLQVVQHDYYQTKAEDNRISIVPIAPNRGNIFDRSGIVLARSFSAYTLEISPRLVPDIDATIKEMESVVEVRASDRSRFRRMLVEAKGANSLPIKTRLSDEEVARFAANRYRFPGVEINARLFRQYPHGVLASHVLGYVGRINDRDIERIEAEGVEANYKGSDQIGKTGLELSYERQLHGATGYAQVEVDAGGRGVRTLSRTAPIAGNNLVLTLDLRLQEVAADAFEGRRGALVAIEPDTGGVLAFVSQPGFDPNLFVDGIDPVSWELLNNSPDKPLNNRALTGIYPPGSTFKPYMALAALELGKRSPTQAIADPGYFIFGGHRFRDDKVGGHGTVDMYKSIVESCDTYYYVLANDMGIDAISRFMRHFGFGARTGIDLAGEATGVLPSQDWKKRRFRRPEQQKWYAGETISVGIGQGYNAYTPLQLAHAVSIIANGGVVYRPHIVNYIDNNRTGERTYIEREPLRTLPLKPQNLEFIRKAMVGVNIDGTGARAFAGAGYTSAGKTGTAQVIALKDNEKYVESRVQERHRDHALFIAFAPVESPKIALAVLVENAGYGARAAAPIARKVLDYYLLGKRAPKPADPATNATKDRKRESN